MDDRRREEACGLLNVHKPAGVTSHDVVAKVRRIAGQRRVGHAGTLDPLATGVLVLCLGAATRLAEFVAGGRKSYCATVRLGVVTSTYDADGEVVAERDASDIDRARVLQALAGFRGDIRQVPPMHAAIKRGGQPLYRLARRGVEVERAPRAVTVHRLELVRWEPPELELVAECSKGTYVRALAHDLGQELGVGAHLRALQRSAVGPFSLSEAVTLDALQAAADGGPDGWRRYLLAPEAALTEMTGVAVSRDQAERIRNGQAVQIEGLGGIAACYAYDAARTLLAVLAPVGEPESDLWRPRKVLSLDGEAQERAR